MEEQTSDRDSAIQPIRLVGGLSWVRVALARSVQQVVVLASHDSRQQYIAQGCSRQKRLFASFTASLPAMPSLHNFGYFTITSLADLRLCLFIKLDAK